MQSRVSNQPFVVTIDDASVLELDVQAGIVADAIVIHLETSWGGLGSFSMGADNSDCELEFETCLTVVAGSFSAVSGKIGTNIQSGVATADVLPYCQSDLFDVDDAGDALPVAWVLPFLFMNATNVVVGAELKMTVSGIISIHSATSFINQGQISSSPNQNDILCARSMPVVAMSADCERGPLSTLRRKLYHVSIFSNDDIVLSGTSDGIDKIDGIFRGTAAEIIGTSVLLCSKTGNINMTNGDINATGLGCEPGHGLGSGRSGTQSGSGAGHAGKGGSSAVYRGHAVLGGAPYGQVPSIWANLSGRIGSGGGVSASNTGGRGGGLVFLSSPESIIMGDGSFIAVDGRNGYGSMVDGVSIDDSGGGGGGSGGTVILSAVRLESAYKSCVSNDTSKMVLCPFISVIGGNGGEPGGGGGSGGFIMTNFIDLPEFHDAATSGAGVIPPSPASDFYGHLLVNGGAPGLGAEGGQNGTASSRTCEPGTTGALCHLCKEGKYKNDFGDQQCAFCPTGQYMAGFGARFCDSCPKGFYTDETGRSICDECGLGTFSNVTAASVCISCTNGPSKNMEWMPNNISVDEFCPFRCTAGFTGRNCRACLTVPPNFHPIDGNHRHYRNETCNGHGFCQGDQENPYDPNICPDREPHDQTQVDII